MKSRAIVSLSVLAAFMLGLATYHPVALAIESFAATKCTSNTACVAGQNSGSGPGMRGIGAVSDGVNGQTKYPSTSASKFGAGLSGQDVSTSGKYDVGVYGQSKRGLGVYGSSNSMAGVAGYSQTDGVAGFSVSGTGKTPNAIAGQDNSGNSNGAGVYGYSKSGTGGIFTTNSSSNGASALLASAANGAFVFVGLTSGSNAVATLDESGNLSLAGEVFTSGSCSSGCARHRVRSYASSAAAPTLEDTGEANLRYGTAYVELDRAFADAADLRKGYYVLITPEAETRGTLYVAARTPAGFTVRENEGGHSTGPFAYRIVAHPFGANGARLPYETQLSVPSATRTVETPAMERPDQNQ